MYYSFSVPLHVAQTLQSQSQHYQETLNVVCVRMCVHTFVSIILKSSLVICLSQRSLAILGFPF